MIKLQDLSLHRGIKPLLQNTSLEIFDQQKVAIIGNNGCGKSSLFALLLGQISADAGHCSVAKHYRTVAIAQHITDNERNAIDYVIDGDLELRDAQKQLREAEQQDRGEDIARWHDTLAQLGAYDVNARASTILSGLGFNKDNMNHPVKSFSGGWQMRLNLARALLCPSDLLLLDEPTNHLDLDAVIWLQDYLQNYRGTLLLISHDQAFIDSCVSTIISFENLSLVTYTGNYSSFQKQQSQRYLLEQKQHEKQQQKRQHLESFISRFKAKASKAKQAQSRIKQLEKMQEVALSQQQSAFSFSFKIPEKLPNPLIDMQNVKLAYGDKVILSKVHLNLVPGSRIGLLGRNGAGKSTLIKLLAKELAPATGDYTTSAGLSIGYFAQHQVQSLNMQSSAFEHLQSLDKNLNDQQIRDYLGGFGFHGDDTLKAVEPMSGGEKARLVLALVVYQKPNLLLLDEPTNHLDINMREALAFALQAFEGAMVIVSHDRFLLSSVCDEFYLVDNGSVNAFTGDLNDYQSWLLQSKSSTTSQVKNNKEGIDRKTIKRLEAEFRQSTKHLRKTVDSSEINMEKIEIQLNQVEQAMADSELYTEENKSKLNQLISQQNELKQAFDECESEWFEAQEQLEQAKIEFDQTLAELTK